MMNVEDSTSTELRIALMSAFLAGFFTLAITFFAGFMNRIKRRNVKNMNALVTLEHLTGEYSAVVDDNRNSINSIISSLPKSGNVVALPLNRMNEVKLEPRVKIDLLDLPLINKIYELEYTLRRFNDDARIINQHLDSFQSGLVNGGLKADVYQNLLKTLVTPLKDYFVFIDKALDEMIELQAAVRIRQRIDKTVSIKVLRYLTTFKKRPLTKDELKKEVKKVRKEYEQTREKSSKEKSELLKKSYRNE